MNQYIEELVNGWGLETDTHVITAIIVLMSVITMCAVFWLIFHLVSPKASHFREMCFKVIICTTAVLLVITTFVGIGGNVVIRERIEEKKTNANIRISSATIMQSYEGNDPIIDAVVEELLNEFEVSIDQVGIYINTYSASNLKNAVNDCLVPLFVEKDGAFGLYSLSTVYRDFNNGDPNNPIILTSSYIDPLLYTSDAIIKNYVGGNVLIQNGAYIYNIVIVFDNYTPYSLERYRGNPVLIEINPNISYDTNYN